VPEEGKQGGLQGQCPLHVLRARPGAVVVHCSGFAVDEVCDGSLSRTAQVRHDAEEKSCKAKKEKALPECAAVGKGGCDCPKCKEAGKWCVRLRRGSFCFEKKH
jgi:hypothetical protein